MFGRRVVLGRVLGFEIRADVSWVFLALLVLWSLAAGLFPHLYPDLSRQTYWLLAIVGTIGLFASLLLHELSHSVVARRYGVEVTGITLFLFGGAAEMAAEPDSPGAEFRIAIAGPIASVVLGAGFYAVTTGLAGLGAPPEWVGVARYLALINIALAVFNLLPAFPMDGGRALRAALWHWGRDLRTATRTASRLGEGLGLVLMGLGVAQALLLGNVVGGMWWFLIGLFVRGNAAATYRQLLDRQSLQGLRAADVMTADPVTVDPDTSLQDLVEQIVYVHHHHRYPVVRDGRLLGHVGTSQVRGVRADEWPATRVRDVLVPADAATTVRGGESAETVLDRLQRSDTGWLMVTDDGALQGVLALRDLLAYLQLRRELEPGG